MLAGVVGTGLGGVLAILLDLRQRDNLSFLLAASGGAMISISLMELVPEAIDVGSKALASFGLLLGCGLLFIVDLLLPHIHRPMTPHTDYRKYHGDRRGKLLSMGMLIGFGIGMHNIPEGLAIGAACVKQQSLGLGVALLIALHNIPEGMAMAVPLKAGAISPFAVVVYTLLAGLPMGAGAWAGARLGALSNQVLSVSFGVAAGAMMYVAGDELIPEAHQCGSEYYPTLGLVLGMFVGVVATFLLGAVAKLDWTRGVCGRVT
ncbi:MAG: ZIP family metal transporter, partial [Bacillota bacterium]